MSVNTSITGALVMLVVVILVAGLIMGLAFAGTDVFNPKTSAAQAHKMQQATDYEGKKKEIELENYRRELEAQAAFEEQQRQLELEHQRGRQAVSLSWMPIRQAVLLGVVSIALLSVGGGLTYYLISMGRRAQRPQPDPWQSPAWRENMRRMARFNEQLLRVFDLSPYPASEPVEVGGNGHDENWP